MGADIVSWNWFIDGEHSSTEQHPSFVFSSAETSTIRLDVVSSNGCEGTASTDVDVLAAPVPDFTIDIGCEGLATGFEDASVSVGNPIQSWLWSVEETVYSTQNVSHVFDTAGVFDAVLEVTGQNFCVESVTRQLEV